MSKPKIKRKPKRRSRPPYAIGQMVQRLTNHREFVPHVLATIDPPMTVEEHDQALYLTEKVFGELEKTYGHRLKLIVPVFLYERTIGGVVEYLTKVNNALKYKKGYEDEHADEPSYYDEVNFGGTNGAGGGIVADSASVQSPGRAGAYDALNGTDARSGSEPSSASDAHDRRVRDQNLGSGIPAVEKHGSD